MSDRATQLINYNVVAVTNQGSGGGGPTPIEGGNALDVSVTEGKGVPIAGVTMPTDGVGLTGWLSAIFGAHGENPPAATGLVDVPPASGKGLLGWLSGIYNALIAPQKTHAVWLVEVTSAGSPFTVAAGALEVSAVNTGTVGALVKAANMPSGAPLYPAGDGGVSVTWRANAGGKLPAITFTVPAGAVLQVSVVD